MFDSLKGKLLLGLYVFLLISIPIGAFLASQTQNVKSSASEPITKVIPKVATPSARQILNASQTNLDELASQLDDSSTPTPSSSDSPTIATSFGPTLSLKATFEGRPAENQATKLFVGIIEGDTLSSNPKFLLSFSINLPASGEYSNLSLAGLSAGGTYTALLKGASQIATSISFTMSPTVSNLNSGEALAMLSGDLNEDNVINSSDYSIVQKAYGSTPSSSNWNPLADITGDGAVNLFDLGIVSKNQGQIGASGAWTSPIPQATSSASINSNTPQGSTGYWVYIPK